MQRYFSNKKIGNILEINKDDLYHIKVVMRLKPNDKIEVVYNNKLYICRINKEYNANIVEMIDESCIKKIKTVLCLPILQEQKMSFILQKATELGISEIIPIVTERSVVKLKEKEEKKLERWNKIVKEASEQSKRLDKPIIKRVRQIDNLNIEGLKLVCSTVEKSNFIKKELNLNRIYDTIVIAVGPEGGFTEKEEQNLKDQGFKPITLGRNILRVETVPLYLLSVINYEYME